MILLPKQNKVNNSIKINETKQMKLKHVIDGDSWFGLWAGTGWFWVEDFLALVDGDRVVGLFLVEADGLAWWFRQRNGGMWLWDGLDLGRGPGCEERPKVKDGGTRWNKGGSTMGRGGPWVVTTGLKWRWLLVLARDPRRVSRENMTDGQRVMADGWNGEFGCGWRAMSVRQG